MALQTRKRVTVEAAIGTATVVTTASSDGPPVVEIGFRSPVLVPESFTDIDSARAAASRLEQHAADLRRAAEAAGQLRAAAVEQAGEPLPDLARRGPQRAPRSLDSPPPVSAPPAPAGDPAADARHVAPENDGARKAPDAGKGK